MRPPRMRMVARWPASVMKCSPFLRSYHRMRICIEGMCGSGAPGMRCACSYHLSNSPGRNREENHGQDHADQPEDDLEAVLELRPRRDSGGRQEARVLRRPGGSRCQRQGAVADELRGADQDGDEEPE